MTDKQRYLYLLTALIASVVLALFTYLQPGIVVAPGFDSSWAYGVNYTFEKHLLVGKDIYFTFGPLGFLAHTTTFSAASLSFSAYVWFACSIISYWLIFILCVQAAPSRLYTITNLILALGLIFYSNDHIQRLLIIAYTSVFLHWYSNKKIYLGLLSAAAIISLLIKFSYGMSVLALLLPYLAIITLRDKNLAHAIFALGCCTVLYLLTWLLLYGQFTGAIGYLQGGLEFSQGSVSAMAVNPHNNWYTILGFYITFMFGLELVSRKHHWGWAIMPLCFLGPLFIWSKYAFGREDSGHLAFLMSYIFYIGIVWAIAADKILEKLGCAGMIVICFFAWKDFSMKASGTAQFLPKAQLTHPTEFKNLLQQEQMAAMMANASDQQLTSLQLPATLRNVIGDSRVDIYPWETLIARYNKLHWTPRPVYQSYITYTPFLDRKNAEFYRSDKAPEFIVWHYHSDQDIDNRYSFNANPLTLQAILTYYQRELCQGSFCVWRHTTQAQLVEQNLPATTPSVTTKAAWNTWIEIPASASADVIRAHINAERTLLGKLNMALWKEGGIEIDYRLTNNDIKTHSLVLDNAPSGIWASPYITDKIATTPIQPVDSQTVQQLLAAKPAQGYIEKTELSSQTLHVAGWGLLPFKNTDTQQLRLLLVSDTHAYSIAAQNRARPGITQHFGQTGKVNLDSCGIHETVDTRDIAPGRYQLHFVVTNEGETRVFTQMPALLFDIGADHAKTTHNVAAIRLRTTRPWAFSNTLTLHWSALDAQAGLPF